MKSLFVAALLLTGLTLRAQQEADDKYVGIYGLIQQATALADGGNPGAAAAAFGDAQSQLLRFQKNFPDWNPNIVSFRLNQVAEKIADLKSRPATAPAPEKTTAPTVPVNAPAAAGDASLQLPTELDNVRTQLRSAQIANELLQAKLREALSVQPAAADPRELLQAREQIRDLMKENDLLKSAQSAAAKPLVVTNFTTVYVTNTVSAVVKDTSALEKLQVLQSRLDENAKDLNAERDRAGQLAQENSGFKSQIAAQQSELGLAKLEKSALEQKLKAATAETHSTAQVSNLADEVSVLRSRLALIEAQPVPYSAEELALLKTATPAAANPQAGEKSIGELPPGTAALVASAQQHFVRQEFTDAEADYLKILERDRNNGIALANLATIELQEGKLADAEKHVTAALAQSPADAYDLSTLGYLKFRQEKYDDALNALGRAAQIDPNNPEIQNYLGVTLSHQGQRKAAEAALRRAIQLNPNYAPAHNNLAVIYLNQEPPMAELARWHYQKALDAGQPRNADLEKLLADKGAPVAP